MPPRGVEYNLQAHARHYTPYSGSWAYAPHAIGAIRSYVCLTASKEPSTIPGGRVVMLAAIISTIDYFPVVIGGPHCYSSIDNKWPRISGRSNFEEKRANYE